MPPIRYYRKEQRQRFQLLVVLLITTGLRITEAVSILQDELASLTKEPKAEKPKAKKSKKVVEAEVPGESTEDVATEVREPTEAELKAIKEG